MLANVMAAVANDAGGVKLTSHCVVGSAASHAHRCQRTRRSARRRSPWARRIRELGDGFRRTAGGSARPLSRGDRGRRLRSYGPLVGHAGDEDEPDPADVACGRWCIARGSAPPLVASRERGSARPQSLRALRTATGPVRSTCHGLLDVTSGRAVRMSASVAASAIASRCKGVSFDTARISERARLDEHSETETTNSASRMSMLIRPRFVEADFVEAYSSSRRR